MNQTSSEAANLAFNEIAIGDEFRLERTFTPDDVDEFARLSGDHSPLHVDQAYAEKTEFGDRVIHGMLLASQFSTLVGMFVPGRPALYLGQDLAFRRPVLIGERVTATARVTGTNAATQTIVLATEIRNAEDKVVVSGTAKVKVRGQQPASDLDTGSDAAGQGQYGAGSGRVALVTGGSRGIGAAIARELARRDYRVAVVCRTNETEAGHVAASIENAGGLAIPLTCDITDRNAVDAMIGKVIDRFGSLDTIVNGAVGELEERPVAEIDWPDIERHLQTQVHGVLNVCQLALPYLEREGGAIVNLLSQVVHGAVPAGMSAYAISKYALLGLSRSLATEWAAKKVRINTVSPGLVRTELTQHYHERIFKMEASRTPLRRVAEGEDIARAVAYLAGSDSSFVTGIDMPVTGGQVIR